MNGKWCKNCLFFVGRIEHGGKCRRYPPSVEAGRDRFHQFVEVALTDWCGEWAGVPDGSVIDTAPEDGK